MRLLRQMCTRVFVQQTDVTTKHCGYFSFNHIAKVQKCINVLIGINGLTVAPLLQVFGVNDTLRISENCTQHYLG